MHSPKMDTSVESNQRCIPSVISTRHTTMLDQPIPCTHLKKDPPVEWNKRCEFSKSNFKPRDQISGIVESDTDNPLPIPSSGDDD